MVCNPTGSEDAHGDNSSVFARLLVEDGATRMVASVPVPLLIAG